MASVKEEAPVSRDSDLSTWVPDDIQRGIVELPMAVRISSEEFGLQGDVDLMLQNADNGDEEAEKTLSLSMTKFLNLMRVQCKLEPTVDPIEDWSFEDQVAAPWGNDYTASAVGVTPRPANWYRNVRKNWRTVLKSLVFWHSQGNSHIDNSAIRKKALEAIKFVNENSSLVPSQDAPKKRKMGRPRKTEEAVS